MTEILAIHRFFPVGQGLFASGSVELWPPEPRPRRNIKVSGQSKPRTEEPFRWVYDCGSSSAKRLVSNGIDELRLSCDGEKIDLLTVSHFHNDHISGVVDVLNRVGAKTVMLPWASLWHRLLIGFDQGMREDDGEMLFFVDPVQYLAREAGDGFEQVLFVMPSTGEGPPFLTEPTVAPESPEDPLDSEKDSSPGDTAAPDDLEISDRFGTSRVRVLHPGRVIPVYGAWEFVPFNDPATRPTDPIGFVKRVDKHRQQLLIGDDEARQKALKDLRALYDDTFGRSAANDVSMILYGGAVGDWRGQRYCDCDCAIHRLAGKCCCWKMHESRAAILLTGDGNLSSDHKWKELERYLDRRRTCGTSVFQVPHHGARANWHEGLADATSPAISIFSSDPGHSYGHPHAEVLRDFWRYMPIQVDQHSGFSTAILLER